MDSEVEAKTEWGNSINGDERISFWCYHPAANNWFYQWQSWIKLQNTYRDRFGQDMPDAIREQLLKELL